MTTFDGRLYWVLDLFDRGPAYGPVQDRRRAERYAEATGGRLFSIAVTEERVPRPACVLREDGVR